MLLTLGRPKAYCPTSANFTLHGVGIQQMRNSRITTAFGSSCTGQTQAKRSEAREDSERREGAVRVSGEGE